jgi:hypothetical protein
VDSLIRVIKDSIRRAGVSRTSQARDSEGRLGRSAGGAGWRPSRPLTDGHTLALVLAASGALNIAFTTGIIARRVGASIAQARSSRPGAADPVMAYSYCRLRLPLKPAWVTAFWAVPRCPCRAPQ